MLIVTALGGNALLRRGQPMTAQNQRDIQATAEKREGRFPADEVFGKQFWNRSGPNIAIKHRCIENGNLYECPKISNHGHERQIRQYADGQTRAKCQHTLPSRLRSFVIR